MQCASSPRPVQRLDPSRPPIVITAEAEVRKWNFTGETIDWGRLKFWVTHCGNALAFDNKKGKYVWDRKEYLV